jgi:3-hydroxyisobutyrate dehydrogenase
MIAFLGTGLLGANFVRAFRRRNEDVHVWNRSPAKAHALEDVGAKAFDHPADAVRGASRVHITVSDDVAVDALLEQARPGFTPDTIIVDHTTTAPVPTGARVRRWTDRGIAFQHAPVFMGPSNALEGTGTMLASGARALYDTLAPALEKMAGKLVYLGDDPTRAASFKLMGNLTIIAMTAGLADVFALGGSLGISAGEVAQLFTWFNPGNALPWRAERMSGGDLSQPTWTLEMARKDARLMIESAAANGVELAMLPAIAAAMDRSIAAGHGADDWMILGRGESRRS